MRTKRLIGLLISVMLIASLAWGCNSEKSGSNDSTKADTSVNDADRSNETDKSDNTNKADDATDKSAAGDKADVSNETNDKSGDSNVPDNSAAKDNQGSAGVNGSLTVETEVANGYTVENGIYRITKGGLYTFTGEIENGQIYVDVEDEVEIALAGVTMSNDSDSCIYINNAEEATVSAKSGTVNVLTDNRARKVSEDDKDKTGSGCIYSKDDLKISGKGELDVIANYNNGIACKNDIKIKNLTLKVSAPGNAIKGNDSITIESGDLTVISTEGDGLKTKNTDISSKGKQRGWIKIKGGIVTIYAADDCIKAAFDFKIEDEATVTEKRYKE